MVTRLLYTLVAVLVLMVAWQSWTLHQVWRTLERDTAGQSYGAAPDKARIVVDAFINYTHRPTKTINADVMDAISREPDTRIVFHVISTGSKLNYKSAQIAMAAARQGRFIAMHEELMRNEKPLTDENVRALAEKIKIDPDRLLKDMEGPEVQAALAKETRAQKSLKIYGSPLFIINRNWLYGPDSEGAARRDLTELINKARAN